MARVKSGCSMRSSSSTCSLSKMPLSDHRHKVSRAHLLKTSKTASYQDRLAFRFVLEAGHLFFEPHAVHYQDMQSAQLCNTFTKNNVNASSCHVCGHCDSTTLTSFCNDSASFSWYLAFKTSCGMPSSSTFLKVFQISPQTWCL